MTGRDEPSTTDTPPGRAPATVRAPRRPREGPSWIAVRGVLCLALLTPGPGAAELVIIAHKDAPDSLTTAQVANIFMGKAAALPGGAIASPHDLPPSDPLRDEFYSKVAGRSAAQARAYWAKMVFTGRGTPPREADSTQDMKRAIAASPSGLGYIHAKDVDDSIKVVLRVP